MKNLLAVTITIIGAIFISAYAICMAVFKANSISDMATSQYILLLIGGIIAVVAGAVLFVIEMKKKD